MLKRGSTIYIASIPVLFNHTYSYSIFFATVDLAKISLVTGNHLLNRRGKYQENISYFILTISQCWIEVQRGKFLTPQHNSKFFSKLLMYGFYFIHPPNVTEMLFSYKVYFYSPIRPSCGGVITDNLVGPVGVSS